MTNLFIDSDVFLDVLARREPFYADSATLLSLAETKAVSALTSPVVMSNLYYLLRRHKGRDPALESLRKLRLFIKILTVSESHIDRALSSGFKDFEDAIQYFASLDNRIEFIITRNKADYKASMISVCSPKEFLEIYDSRK